MLIEIIGYAASALIAVSLLMVSVLRLRIINLAGAICFVIYGVAIGAVPLVITNGFITVVNVYHILRILRTRPSSFRYAQASRERREEIQEFIDHYRTDIAKYYPDFAVDLVDEALEGGGTVYLAVHNLRLEGIAYLLDIDEAIDALSGTAARPALERAHRRPHEGEMSYLGIDYITAQYRDLGLAQELYEQIGRHMEERTVVCLVDNSARRSKRFLSSNGFTPVFAEDVEEPTGGSPRRLVLFARTFVAGAAFG